MHIFIKMLDAFCIMIVDVCGHSMAQAIVATTFSLDFTGERMRSEDPAALAGAGTVAGFLWVRGFTA